MSTWSSGVFNYHWRTQLDLFCHPLCVGISENRRTCGPGVRNPPGTWPNCKSFWAGLVAHLSQQVTHQSVQQVTTGFFLAEQFCAPFELCLAMLGGSYFIQRTELVKAFLSVTLPDCNPRISKAPSFREMKLYSSFSSASKLKFNLLPDSPAPIWKEGKWDSWSTFQVADWSQV
jgi:hypothetical protein